MNIKKIAAGLLVLLVGGMIFSTLFHIAAGFYDRRSYPAPGRLIDVGGHRPHLHCLGEGEPTVLLEAGMSGWSVDWALVQPTLAQETRVCTYDRAGYGWSEPGPLPRDSQHAAADLHALLSGAGIEDDLILVGHSLGGLFVQYYARTYPEQIAGIVLVDSVHPEQSLRMNEEDRARYEGSLRSLTRLSSFLAPTGLLRLAGQPVTTISAKLPDEIRGATRATGFMSRGYRALDAEMAAFQQSQAQVRAAGPLPAVPLAVLSSTLVQDFPPGFNQGSIKNTWDELQADLSRSATLPQVIAGDSGHYIHLDRSELVIQTIQEVIRMADAD